ncbi:MAG: 2-oxoglutarate dehydrogenase E1 component [Polyangiaceae bacterium]|nr:2-oxoglutarate dehydrogenase E1 component [Polyangiaceae bacterium]
MADLNFGINAGLVEELYAQYLDNPESVDPSWRSFFDERMGTRRVLPSAWMYGPQAGKAAMQLTAETKAEVVPTTIPSSAGTNGVATTTNGPTPAAKTGNGSNGSARAHQAAVQAHAVATEAAALAVERAFDATTLPTFAPQVLSIAPTSTMPDTGGSLAQAAVQARVFQLLNAYRVRGHLYARVNPLEEGDIQPATFPDREKTELDLRNFGLSHADFDLDVPTVDMPGPSSIKLKDLVQRLEETYCRFIGVEYTHIEDRTARVWLRERMEATHNRLQMSKEQQLRILTKLTEAEVFEQFIHGSYGAGTKRFSLEGAESVVSLLDLLVERSADEGVEEVVLGMAHRGRLNVLVNIMDKSLREIFAAFEDADGQANLGRGDVKYHLGFSTDRTSASNKKIHLTLTFNPSHLEFVNPVVEGRVRAKQDRRQGRNGAMSTLDRDTMRRVMPLLIHGDAAFIGQGIVPETLNLCGLEGYKTGGTIHLIVNNQVGFTTDPLDSRSTRYASDITRMLKVPVFHVNGEDPEAVAQVAQLAIEYRQRFQQDVVIDMYCYRKYGHNEGDEPRYTQPRMYHLIDKKPTVRRMYIDHLLGLGHITEDIAERCAKDVRDRLEHAFREVKEKGCVPGKYWMGGVWAPYRGGRDVDTPEVPTCVSKERLAAISEGLLTLPSGFKVHPKVMPILRGRHDKLVSGEPFDWGTAEALAYGTLLDEGYPVRISGQDVRRGTFSHRHAVLFDSDTGLPHAPHAALCRGRARFDVFNSPLSEAGVLGFEFGYSLDYPDALIMWEAQFGDFLNGAQVIVDQFLTSSEDKWHRLSGLVLLLPHGYEGQGPEHSSARLERFLSNSAEDNIQVCNLTTPAQLFHVLRRQVLRPWRKPLAIMTPKSLLRVAATSKGAHRPVSTITDLTTGSFQRIIPDTVGTEPSKVRKVLLCSGKVYYDLAVEREARQLTDIAIIRVEQLYPLGEEIVNILAPYKDGTPLVWVQEEPQNFGAWYFINAKLPAMIDGRLPLSSVARAPSASPATGSRAAHLIEQRQIIDEALA